jgi:two-component system C4-dicarboxylate transport response regulator DctD
MNNPTLFKMTPRIVLIDDERAMRESISQWLSLADCEVCTFADSRSALDEISSQFEGVLVTDLKMPELDGMGVLQAVMHIDRDIPVVLITGHGDINSAVEAMQHGAYDFIEKPFAPERLLSTIKRAAEKRELILQNRQLRVRAQTGRSIEERLLGECASIRQIRHNIQQFADVDVDILIVGETGTGKEVVARALHDFSPRKTCSFKALDCGALPQEHIEQVLFGSAGKQLTEGPFEQAKGGTVFLDEVTNMPANHQVKLLRVLEQREVQRIGEASPRALDIRVLSAANPLIDEYVGNGSFRTDLLFRLNTLEIRLPPLRDRDDDCVLLFEHFSRQASATYEREVPMISSQDITALRSHDWSGNVRELKNVAERFVLLQNQPIASLIDPGDTASIRTTLAQQMLAFEKSIIEYAMNHCGGNIADTSEYLGLPRRTLSDKIQKHGIDRTLIKP